jgi:hypothetical protein
LPASQVCFRGWLTEVKERLPHGKFLSWLKGEFGWAERTAQNFMRVYELSKSANFADLTLDISALYLIAARSTPEPIVREVLERAKNEPMSHAEAKRLLREYQGRMELPTPTVARRIALATGKAVAANNNMYILPMSKDDEDALAEENNKIRALYDAIETIAKTEVTAAEMVRLGEKHACYKLVQYCESAHSWIKSVLKEAKAATQPRLVKRGVHKNDR